MPGVLQHKLANAPIAIGNAQNHTLTQLRIDLSFVRRLSGLNLVTLINGNVLLISNQIKRDLVRVSNEKLI